MDDADPPDDSTPVERKALRVGVRTEVGIRKPGHGKSSGWLIDVSHRGCRVELIERVNIGDHLWIRLPGLDSVEAKVAWTRDWIAGLEFVNPLYPAVFDMIVARLKQ